MEVVMTADNLLVVQFYLAVMPNCGHIWEGVEMAPSKIAIKLSGWPLLDEDHYKIITQSLVDIM